MYTEKSLCETCCFASPAYLWLRNSNRIRMGYISLCPVAQGGHAKVLTLERFLSKLYQWKYGLSRKH